MIIKYISGFAAIAKSRDANAVLYLDTLDLSFDKQNDYIFIAPITLPYGPLA